MESPPRRVHRRKPAIEPGVAINDSDLYARMSAPFATSVEATTALGAFLVAVCALRIKHRIADVVTVALVNVAGEPVITYGQNGSEEVAPMILAWALGKEQAASKARIEERIAAMVASGGASKPPERASSLTRRAAPTSRSIPDVDSALPTATPERPHGE